jgi:hypothetical protein
MVSPKFNSIFPMLPDPIPYLESESLSSLRHFLDLAVDFLIAFMSLSNFSLNWAKDCLAGLGFFPPFVAARKSAFSDLSFSCLRQSFVLCIVCMPPCFLQRLQCFSKRTFLGILVVDSVPGHLFPLLLLMEAFLPEECALDISCIHTCSIALRDVRSKRMSTGVIPFSLRLNWPCHVSGHIQRT